MAVTLQNPIIPGMQGGGDSDRLSNLPEHIIQHIFSFLETIDVVRASAVSRKWRYFWVSMPYLDFDIDAFRSKTEESLLIETAIEKFKEFVNWVLLFQDNSIVIRKFSLCCLNILDDYAIHRWITVVAQRKVQELSLDIFSRVPFQLPTCQSLITLRLGFDSLCILKLPTFAGFSRLKSLHLWMVIFIDSSMLGNFISSCPLLENLNIEQSFFCNFKVFEICSTSLKNLIVHSGDEDDPNGVGDGLGNCEIKIACPRLVSLNFVTPSTWNFCFQDVNSLQKVFIYFYHDPKHATAEECRCVLSKILEGLRNVTALKLSMGFFMFLYQEIVIPKFFSTSFNNLKSLTLMVCMNLDKQAIINFLNLSPSLQALTIYFGQCPWSEYLKIPDIAISCLTYHLKMVRLHDFEGRANELELVRFLLKNGQVLQKLSISWLESVKIRRKIIRRIVQLPRSSSNVSLEPNSKMYGIDFFSYEH
ncbi:hypothetical protein Dsin_005462 [Dipteronia sinensis]|uniref:F-box domain-containing protein n=1 Tax=Dipteronia sinensis TaxID=43782 RepID=A0AAE0AXM1_9ROSI|nr:hypothetical protein Dsin_005462 [Dipteronia sinensis]